MSSGFVTETELEEKKKVRQEEWEKVRKPEDPAVAPDEPVDNRSLFERLDEQRQKKQDDWDEEHKFKNQFRGLDDDEVDFLDRVDDVRTEVERQRHLDERRELEEYQKRQLEVKERELEERLENERKGPGIRRTAVSTKHSQMKLLAGAVKRKSDVNIINNKKTKEDSEPKAVSVSDVSLKTDKTASSCVGLLGLVDYGSGSESDESS
eukprot:GFUD01029598.1.p1 GENE.GFUD01029598.1~~GFUD01029598.1.p1  ORF type:complete len:208 (-),score=87.65 GFUD01029598.1:90-713(-)